MPFRPTEVLVHDEHEQRYMALERDAARRKQPEAAIWKGLQTALARIRQDAQWGEVIPRDKIPRYFTRRYQTTNLYCVDLADFHRLFYTIVGHSVVFLDLVDHSQHDKWFPGRLK